MTEVFGPGYASAYDDLYAEKDYDAECDLIESVAASRELLPSRILDLGCGTGGHALRLAQRGYDVTGVDRSASMIERAEEKARSVATSGAITFSRGDLLDLDLGATFDVALMMFAVLGYQHENRDVLAALRTARRHLRPGGLLIFDVWFGPAVLSERPAQRVRTVRGEGEEETIRISTPTVDIGRHLCTVAFQLIRIDMSHVVRKTDEQHAMRFFFPLELEHFLERAEFDDVAIGAFPDFARSPDETTWNVMVVARAA
jgi:SAM-dependent methyltransferase